MNKAAQALHRLKNEPRGNNCRALAVFLQEVSLARQPETPPSSSTLFPASLQHTSAVSTPLNEMAETMLSEIELRFGACKSLLSSGRDGIDPER